MKSKKFSVDLEGKNLIIEVSQLAEQANGSVLARLGDTIVLATVVMIKHQREGVDYLPLTVEYEEKFYAAGKISGSRFIKREGRPSEEAILAGRLIDRAIRPRFNQKIRNDIQVVLTVLSLDTDNDPDIVALNAASTALMISDIPWNGPVSAVRVGRKDGKFIINPTYAERESSDLDLVVAGFDEKINMIEAGAKEIAENNFDEALMLTQKYLKKISDFQRNIAEEIGKEKQKLEIPTENPELKKEVKDFLADNLEKAIYEKEKTVRQNKISEIRDSLMNHLKQLEKTEETLKMANLIFEEEIDEIVSRNILEQEKRPDGRQLNELREIYAEIGILPRTHGSGLFIRGNTQALSILTLGSPGDEQTIEGMEFEGKKRFMHHYNFPPYSVGEIGRLQPGRREIGHGALAERALLPLIPPREEFPYTIRIVSEILSSNGSSSMASVCGSTLALMDAGVPIKKPVAGIAMGLIMKDENNYKILTDIQGPEDHHGDMDLKIAGTRDGITALQMDVKVEGVTPKILKEAFSQAKEARLQILDKIESVISSPRPNLSPLAPRITVLKINPEKIGSIIGPGGKVINEIIAQTGAAIDIEDDGTVFITSPNEISANRAITWVKDLTRELKVGEILDGKVSRILDFGAIVDLTPGQDGLLHISELAPWRVEKTEDIINIGDVIPVKIKKTEEGKISLSLKDVAPPEFYKDKKRGVSFVPKNELRSTPNPRRKSPFISRRRRNDD